MGWWFQQQWDKARVATADAVAAGRTVLFYVVSTATGAAALYVVSRGNSGVLVVTAVAIGAALVPLVVVFVWGFFTAPHRALVAQVNRLEEAIDGMQGQIGRLMQDEYGDPLRFLPIYQELRTDVRTAIRTIERARDTGALWARTDAPQYGDWKKHKAEIAENPWARIDGLHGDLLEAFEHVERLATRTAVRFGRRRRVRDSDDLGGALDTLKIAEARLTFSINRLEEIQVPDEARPPENQEASP